MSETNLETISHREIGEHRRTTVYVAGLGVALLIIVGSVTAALLIIGQIVRS